MHKSVRSSFTTSPVLYFWLAGCWESTGISTFSGGDNCVYYMYIGPMLKSSGALLQACSERYRQPAMNLPLLKMLSKLLESWKMNDLYTEISGTVLLLSRSNMQSLK